MAFLNNTEVKYYPTSDTRNGILKGQIGTITLDSGDCFLVQGKESENKTNDLTGTLITSNNPIGVLSGHVRTSVMQGLDYDYDTKDHLAEILPPIKAWGKHFVSVPFIDGRNVSTNNYNFFCKEVI